MSENGIQRCTYCVMDNNSDGTIRFNASGECNYCREARVRKGRVYFPNEEGETRLAALLEEIKREGEGKPYDCLMGVSGGLDSSYLAYLGAAKWGLRIAAVHVDDGYDTEISRSNVRKLCDAAKIELVNISPDEEQFNDLTLAFMKAGVPNIAMPQDNILLSELYSRAVEGGITYLLSGGNFALECILQQGNTWSNVDVVNIIDIHRRFGEKGIDRLRLISASGRRAICKRLGVRSPRLLNYVDYNRDRAFAELKDFCGFEYYGRKHLENYLTAFAQLYWLPKKFNVDKRTSHLSSMIVSGQIAREEALAELAEPLYEDAYMQRVKNLLCEKMGISLEYLEELSSTPGKQHDEYAIDRKEQMRAKLGRGLRALLGR